MEKLETLRLEYVLPETEHSAVVTGCQHYDYYDYHQAPANAGRAKSMSNE